MTQAEIIVAIIAFVVTNGVTIALAVYSKSETDEAKEQAKAAMAEAKKAADALAGLHEVERKREIAEAAKVQAPARLESWLRQGRMEIGNTTKVGGVELSIPLADEVDVAAALLGVAGYKEIAAIHPTTFKLGDTVKVLVDNGRLRPEAIKKEAQTILETWAFAGRELGLKGTSDEGELMNVVGFAYDVRIITEAHLEAARMARTAKDMGVLSISPATVRIGEWARIVVANPKYVDLGPYPRD